MSRVATVVTVAVLAAGLMIAACGEDVTGPEPQPGSLQVSLTTPATDDGAVLMTVSGENITNLRLVSAAHQLYSRPGTGNSVRVIVVGDIASGPLVLFDVPDINRVERYLATVAQVASRDNVLRPLPLTGYDPTVVSLVEPQAQ